MLKMDSFRICTEDEQADGFLVLSPVVSYSGLEIGVQGFEIDALRGIGGLLGLEGGRPGSSVDFGEIERIRYRRSDEV